MGLRPTHGDENARLELIDSKWVMHDFQGSVLTVAARLRQIHPGASLLMGARGEHGTRQTNCFHRKRQK
jgi:hypothetical protein